MSDNGARWNVTTNIEQIVASGPKNGTIVVTIQQLDIDFNTVGKFGTRHFAHETCRPFNSRYPNTQLRLILAIQRFRILDG